MGWSGDDTQQTQQQNTVTSAPSNPAVNSTITSLAQGIQNEYNKGPAVFNQPLYAGVGNNTQQGWNLATAAASNPAYASSVNGAIQNFGDWASGKNSDGNDPAFQRDLARTVDDTSADINAQFGASGRFGSTPYVGDLTKAIGGVRDSAYLNERNNSRAYAAQAAQMLPSLYSAAQLPASTYGAVGAAQDADKQAGLLAQNDLFRRTNDAWTDLLAKLTSTSAGNAAAGGMTSTSNGTTIQPTTPWWQSALGLGLALA